MIHSFPAQSTSSVTTIVQSPAIDVVGIGYADGTVIVYDILQGEPVMQMKLDDGSVTCLSFRMGRSDLATQMLLAMWDVR
jgi:U3 small nucleolar RNA-associated protein 21